MNLMTVDLESWVHRPVFKIPLERQTKELDNGRLVKSTNKILDLFKENGISGTFFVLGSVAEWYPDLIEDIYSKGHEIAIHGYTHKTLNNHTEDSFSEEVARTIEILSDLSEKPMGFRSPTFSFSDWMYEVLRKHGFRYDSSVFPMKTPLYDGSRFGTTPFSTSKGLVELPISVYKFGMLKLPVGGFYLRALGLNLNKIVSDLLSRKGYLMFYFHPWEVYKIPDLKIPLHKKIFAYYNIPMLSKIDKLIKNFSFTSVKDSWELIMEHFTDTG